ncbi:MAG: hypothetical protein RRC34_16360 [Lentisphaeria bacterium]|nr:hypothetical protein [Lentisphaeria bacterium]
MQKIAGWIMVVIAGLIILANVVDSKYNVRQVEDHPWITLFSGGKNLKECYTFKPPYTGFEITVIAAGVIGVIMIFTAPPKKEENENEE